MDLLNTHTQEKYVACDIMFHILRLDLQMERTFHLWKMVGLTTQHESMKFAASGFWMLTSPVFIRLHLSSSIII